MEPEEIMDSGRTFVTARTIEIIKGVAVDLPLRRVPLRTDFYFEPGVGPWGAGVIRSGELHPIHDIRTIFVIRENPSE